MKMMHHRPIPTAVWNAPHVRCKEVSQNARCLTTWSSQADNASYAFAGDWMPFSFRNGSSAWSCARLLAPSQIRPKAMLYARAENPRRIWLSQTSTVPNPPSEPSEEQEISVHVALDMIDGTRALVRVPLLRPTQPQAQTSKGSKHLKQKPSHKNDLSSKSRLPSSARSGGRTCG